MMDNAVITTREPSRTSQRDVRNDIPMDVRLPQLSTILDREAMSKALLNGLFESARDRDRFLIRHCEIIQVRYKPASSCMVSYRLDIEHVETGERTEQILCGRGFPEGRSRSQWEKAATRALVQPRFGKPLIHLLDLEMVLWSFPNDRKMHTLPASIDGAISTSSIPPSWLLSHLGAGWQVANTKSRVMHYVGEHTCTVRTSLELVQPSENMRKTLTIFGKTYYNEDGAQTDRVMRQLWDSEARRGGQLGVAQPLWYDTRLKTLWQLGIHGATLENHTIEAPASVLLLTKAARAVATLHTIPVSDLRLITVADLLDTLDKVSSMLLRAKPSCRPILSPLVARLITQANTIPAAPTVTLHGDLHLKNLFLTADTIALIDLDNVCQGHPGQDIGSFIAGLLTGALAKHVPWSQVARPILAFLDHYDQYAPWKLDQPTLAWFTVLALVIERSHRCVTRLKDGRLGMLEPLLQLADEISRTGSLSVLATAWADTHGKEAVS